MDPEPVLGVMNTLVCVAYREYQKVIETIEVADQSQHLIQLLCALQTSLLAWCNAQLNSDDKHRSQLAESLLIKCK